MGVALNNVATILSQAATATGDVISSAVTVVVPDGSTQDFKAVFQGTWTPTGVTSPTFDGGLQGSWDGGNTWVTLGFMTQRTAAGSFVQVVDVQPGMKVRGSYDVGGTGGSHAWTGAILLVSSSGFKTA